jgi:hypothetical protein
MSRKETDMDMDMTALTYVKIMANFSTKVVRLRNHEDTTNQSCGPQDIETTLNIAVPWAPSKGDYDNNKKITVGYWESNGKLVTKLWLWESNGAIYYNTVDAWSATASKVPGDSWGGGIKAFAIRETNDTLSISLVKVP